MKYAWVKATNLSDKLTIPEITIETEGNPVNGWYGADKKELWIKVSTNSPSAKEIYYTLLGAHIQEETKGELKEENGMKYIKVPITEIGLTRIIAHTEDGNGYSSEENSLEVKFDNIPPILEVPIRTGTEGTNSWYKSDIDVMVNAKDLNGKEETSLKDPKATLNGYIYKVLKEDNTEIIQETHIKDIEKAITTRDIDNGKDGIYILHIKAIDEAGNTSSTQVIELRKDTTPPLVEVPQITNVTETGFQLTVSAGDTTSGIAYYEYYINNAKIETRDQGTWIPNNLSPNSINNVKVIVYDNAGNSKASINTPVTTKGELKAPNIQVNGTTRNGYYIGTVTISVSDTSESTKTRVSRIKVTGAGSERNITGTSGSFTITADGTYTISAWSEDASGNKSTTTTKPAFTRDATAPSTASVKETSHTKNTITVLATAADATSGVKNIQYQYKLTSTNDADSQWTTAVSQIGKTYTYPSTKLTAGKTYDLRIIVTDNAGWTKKSSKITVNTNTAPTITASYASKDTNYIKINATGKDADGDKLTYKLYVSTDGTNWGTAKATLSNQTQNTQVTLMASGLSEYTEYYWKVEVTDSYTTANTGKQGWVRTYCPGKYTNGTTCEKCYGYGLTSRRFVSGEYKVIPTFEKNYSFSSGEANKKNCDLCGELTLRRQTVWSGNYGSHIAVCSVHSKMELRDWVLESDRFAQKQIKLCSDCNREWRRNDKLHSWSK
ncbi:MAG: hypothetical protein HFJ52_00950 [Clostridia bacterium]|nr:hypothetical protein [Clostridia bacterium]